MKKREDYLYISALLRAREARMLGRERAERLTQASSWEECVSQLAECGYEELSSPSLPVVDKALSHRREAVFRELALLSPDAEPVDLFRIRYDCHNAKTVLKAEKAGRDPLTLMSFCGRTQPEAFLDAVRQDRPGDLPGAFSEAYPEASDLLSRTGDPARADMLLDRTCFEELSETAEKTGSSLLTDYVSALADGANLKSAVRALRRGRGTDTLREALVPGGKADRSRLLTGLSADALSAAFDATQLAGAALLAESAAAGGSMTKLEKACDDAAAAVLTRANLLTCGPEIVAAYLAKTEAEISAVRMILTGRLTGTAPEAVRERMRELYV